MRAALLLLSLLPSFAHAAENCAERGYKLKGKVKEQVSRYDNFVISVQGKKNPLAEIQAHLEKYGLPFTAEIKKGGVKQMDAWLEREGMGGGKDASIFLRKLAVPEKSGLRLDDVYLFAGATEKKPVHVWKVPFNAFYPAGVQEDELIFHSSLYAFCRESESVEIALAVKPDGSLRVIDWPADEKLKELSACPAKKVFRQSDYASCSEIADKKTKQKKVLVFEQPMN